MNELNQLQCVSALCELVILANNTLTSDSTSLKIWFDGVWEVEWKFSSNDNGECYLNRDLLGFTFLRTAGLNDTITERYRYEIGRSEDNIGEF